jgi:MoaA/NifB/PqqE/SkfB family radical SAM enzyme
MKPGNIRLLPNLVRDHIQHLPLVVLYLTDGCNSRCAMCDIWKAPRANMSTEVVASIVTSIQPLGIEMVLLSGGEAMQHPKWPMIANQFKQAGVKVWLLTNGLLLKKQAEAVLASIDMVTVSLDAATPELYQRIRGVDALDVVLEGMQVIEAGGIPVTTRTTLMQINYSQMPQIVDVALAHGAQQVSFLTVDTTNPYAFGPRFSVNNTLPLMQAGQGQNPFGGLSQEELPEFQAVLASLFQTHAHHFSDGRIAESQAKLQTYFAYFAEPYGLGRFSPPRCNAPHLSLVVNVDGRLQPCYFLPHALALEGRPLHEVINAPSLVELRRTYRSAERAECARCVCPLYRGPRALLKGF